MISASLLPSSQISFTTSSQDVNHTSSLHRYDGPMRTGARRVSVSNVSLDTNIQERDEYGFLKSSSEDAKTQILWVDISRTGFSTGSWRVKQAIRRGIPQKYRKEAWFVYSGAQEMRQEGYLDTLLVSSTPALELIQCSFDADCRCGAILSGCGKLFEQRILDAVRSTMACLLTHRPKLEYSQTLASIVALVVVVQDGDMEKSFWILESLLSRLPSDWFEELHLQMFLDRDVFLRLFADKLPRLHKHCDDLKIPLNMLIGAWFQNLFVGYLPPNTVLHFFDALLHEGVKVVHRTGLALLKLNESQLLNITSPQHLFRTISQIPGTLHNSQVLMETAFDRIGALSLSTIESYRLELRDSYMSALDVRRFSIRKQRMSLSAQHQI